MEVCSANSSHRRSISLPSTSHPSLAQVEECLNLVRSWLQSSALKQRQSVKTGLDYLRELHLSTINFLQLPLTQQSLYGKETLLNELIEVFVGLLDVCGIMKDSFSQLKEQYQYLSSQVRRKDSSLHESIGIYQCFRRRMRKHMIIYLRSLRSLRINRNAEDDGMVCGILINVNTTTISMFKILIQLASGQKAPQSAFSKLRLLRYKRCDKNADGSMASEIESLDAALNAVYDQSPKEAREENIRIAYDQMVALDSFLGETEFDMEILFRCLINFRASLLNIMTGF